MVFLALPWSISLWSPTHPTSACSLPLALVPDALPAPLLHQSVLELRDCLLCGAFMDPVALELL